MIVVGRVLGLATVQDLGRPGRMHEGLAHGGALVPELLIDANRAIGNPDNAPAIEVCGRLVLEIDGVAHTIESEPRRVAYFAVRGGVDAPLVLGGRGTQLTAGIGAMLRAGDRVESAGATTDRGAESAVATTDRRAESGATADHRAESAVSINRDASPVATVHHEVAPSFGNLHALDARDPIRLIAGPEQIDGVLDALCGAEYTIAPASDRVGTRLDGPRIAHAAVTRVSRPLVCGAIELPHDGLPIVMGREHPTTGGYPVIAVVASADLGRLFAIRLGGNVRFTI